MSRYNIKSVLTFKCELLCSRALPGEEIRLSSVAQRDAVHSRNGGIRIPPLGEWDLIKKKYLGHLLH